MWQAQAIEPSIPFKLIMVESGNRPIYGKGQPICRLYSFCLLARHGILQQVMSNNSPHAILIN